MHMFSLVINIITCILLVIGVLLQAGKGADLGAVFGGGSSQALFGSAGPADFLNKATRVLVGIFMVTSLTLGYFATSEPTKSVMGTAAAQAPKAK